MTAINKILIALTLLTFTAPALAQKPNKPFPQHVKYTSGTIIPSQMSQKELDNRVRSFYILWK